MLICDEQVQAVLRNRDAAWAENTLRGLRNGWARWEDWARGRGVQLLPAAPQDVEVFLVAHLAGTCGYAPNTIAQSLWAMNHRHTREGLEPPGRDPQVRTAMHGLWRRLGGTRRRQKPLTIEQIACMDFGRAVWGERDKALLLLGFAACLRRSELSALNVADVQHHGSGLLVRIVRSKTDQEGAGATIYVPRAEHFPHACPVAALDAWLAVLADCAVAGPPEPALFRGIKWGKPRRRLSGVDINRIVKEHAAAAGLGPGYGGHSLRAGCATWLDDHGVSVAKIARHGRWKKLDSVLTYCRGDVARAVRGTY